MPKWECDTCGVIYSGDEPSLCPDCTGESFSQLEDEQTESESDAMTSSSSYDTGLLPSGVLRDPAIILGVLIVIGLIGVGVLTLTSGSYCDGVDGPPADSTTLDRQHVECSVHDRLNDLRQDRDLSTLSFDGQLHETARSIAEEAAANNYTPSEVVDEQAIDVWQRVADGPGSCETDADQRWFSVYRYPNVGTMTNAEVIQQIVEDDIGTGAQINDQMMFTNAHSSHTVGTYITGAGQIYVVQFVC
jgi:predicted  nucleic acid-binding Zn-ribbon protein